MFSTPWANSQLAIYVTVVERDLPISSVSPFNIVVWLAIPTLVRSESGSKPLETAHLNFCRKRICQNSMKVIIETSSEADRFRERKGTQAAPPETPLWLS